MEFSITFHTIKSEWSIIYSDGPQIISSKQYCILSLKINVASIYGSSMFAKVSMYKVSSLQTDIIVDDKYDVFCFFVFFCNHNHSPLMWCCTLLEFDI